MADSAAVMDAHAQEFTDIERQTLQIWLDVDNAGNEPLADQVLNAGLQFEHFTSLLPNDPAQRTQDQFAHNVVLSQRLAFAVQQAEAFLREQGPGTGDPRVDPRLVEYGKRIANLEEQVGKLQSTLDNVIARVDWCVRRLGGS